MDERVQRIKALIEQDINIYRKLIGEDISEHLGGVLLGYVCTAHIGTGAFAVTALMGLSELEKQLSRPRIKVKFSNTCKCLADIVFLSENRCVEELEELKKYANKLMGYED